MTEVLNLLLQVSQELKVISSYILELRKSRLDNFKETWIDGQDVMQTMHISKRTLQSLRDSGTLPFSRINGKFYYKVFDIEAMLDTNYEPSKPKGNGSK
jgi:hypothetical protein